MTAAGRIEPNRFATDEYRILAIRVLDAQHRAATVFRLGDPACREPTTLQFGGSFRLQVDYECLMPELPDASCGAAAALTRVGDMEPIMYFNTIYPHSDEEMANYDKQEFRKYIGRQGTIEAQISNLQIKPGEYLLTVGILPNQATHHEFYELHYLQYPIRVVSEGPDVPAAFYAKVTFRHERLECDDRAGGGSSPGGAPEHDRAAPGVLPTPAMIQTGVAVLREHLASEPSEIEKIVTAVYVAMTRSAR